MRFKMVLNCNTSADYYFVMGNNVTIKGVRYMSQCKCVIVELFDSVHCTHSIMSLTQYCIVELWNGDRVIRKPSVILY